MRSAVFGLILALSLMPVAALAQGAPPGPNGPPPGNGAPPGAMPAPRGSITRDQYVNRAEQRAGRRAGAMFDQMDVNHTGILTPDDIRAWRAQHPRPGQPPPQ